MANYKLLYPVSGLSTLYGDVLRGDSMTKQEGASVQLSDSGEDFHYLGTVGVTLQAGDVLAYYLFDDPDYLPITREAYQPDVTPVGGSSSLVIPAGYVGDYLEDDIVYFLWKTAQTPTVNGSVLVYKDNDDVEVTLPTGITDDRDFDSRTNLHLCTIDLNANTFYDKGTDYSVILSGATIDGTSVNAVIATFSIENRYAGKQFIRDG